MSNLLQEVKFQGFPKLARLNRDIVISEKIDGTNAAAVVAHVPFDSDENYDSVAADVAHERVKMIRDESSGDPALIVYAQSRKRLITPADDNFGFAKWVFEHAETLSQLGSGYHFGEWWGSGIQRGYGLQNGEKRFSLFNPETTMSPEVRSIEGLDTVPVLYEGPFRQEEIFLAEQELLKNGSRVAPGFMDPEGIVIYHTAARTSFKVTLENDEKPKSQV